MEKQLVQAYQFLYETTKEKACKDCKHLKIVDDYTLCGLVKFQKEFDPYTGEYAPPSWGPYELEYAHIRTQRCGDSEEGGRYKCGIKARYFEPKG